MFKLNLFSEFFRCYFILLNVLILFNFFWFNSRFIIIFFNNFSIFLLQVSFGYFCSFFCCFGFFFKCIIVYSIWWNFIGFIQTSIFRIIKKLKSLNHFVVFFSLFRLPLRSLASFLLFSWPNHWCLFPDWTHFKYSWR